MGKLAWRFLQARKLRTLIAVLSVALGVGLLTALLTLNAATERALDEQIARQFGTYELMAGYRKPETRFAPADLEKLQHLAGVVDVAGVLIPYMGNTPSAVAERGASYYGAPNTDLGRQFMRLSEGTFPGPGEAAVAPAWAKKQNLKIGDTVQLPFPPNGDRTVRISGMLDLSSRMGVGILLFDRSWLEEATARPGATFALVDTQGKQFDNAVADSIRKEFDGVEVDLRKGMTEIRRNMDAMRPVALGMGLAALLAAAFLLSGSFRMSLAERTRELAMLRAIAATPGQVRRLILLEGLVLGLVGAVLGALLGVAGAAGAAGAVARLLATEPGPLVVPVGQMLAAAAGGVVLTLLSALGVARSAARTEPLRALRPDLPEQEEGARTGGRFGLVLAGLGVAGLVASAFVPTGPDSPLDGALRPLLGSTGGLAVALGLILGAQRILPLLLPLLAAPFRGRTEGPLAVRNLLRHRRRSGSTLGALSLGLMLVLALATIASTLLGRWEADVRHLHPADLQFEVPFLFREGLDPGFLDKVLQLPGVTKVGAVSDEMPMVMTDWDFAKADPEWLSNADALDRALQGGSLVRQRQYLTVNTGDLAALTDMGVYRLVAGSADRFAGNALVITDELARQRGIRLGDRVNLKRYTLPLRDFTPDGAAPYTVVAVVHTDSYRMPDALVPATTEGAPDRLRMVYVNVLPGQKAAAREQARTLVQTMEYNIADYSDVDAALAEYRAQVNQRFALLVAVGVVMAMVATMSLLNAMVSSVNDRRREFALLRSVGATPGQTRNVVLLEAGLLGGAGALVGIAGGVVLGAGALYGLDLPLDQLQLPWAAMAGSLVLSLGLAMLAATGPARWVMQTAPARAVRVD